MLLVNLKIKCTCRLRRCNVEEERSGLGSGDGGGFACRAEGGWSAGGNARPRARQRPPAATAGRLHVAACQTVPSCAGRRWRPDSVRRCVGRWLHVQGAGGGRDRSEAVGSAAGRSLWPARTAGPSRGGRRRRRQTRDESWVFFLGRNF
jgi:hypothetical protein